MRLRKVISGAQSGADIAGLKIAKQYGFETGGIMPFGYKTLDGPKPEYKQEYGLTAHKSSNYVPRTRANVRDSDGTIRLAFDFTSRGERCTLKAIEDYNRPYIDVDLSDPRPISEVVVWLTKNKIEVLNVAGNAEQTAIGTFDSACVYLDRLFQEIMESE